MAEVFLAVTGAPGAFTKLQVLKLLRPDLSEDDRADFVRMFEYEACLAARLNHPNIVQSHEAGVEDGQHFIVMEYLDGQPLCTVQDRVWKAGKTFPLEMQLLGLCQLLEALEYAHNLLDYDGQPLNIIHRDVSPQNVFITYAGPTKLVDFGIAKTLESNQTRAGVVKGKVPYMSREQILGGELDRRTDLFSVGVMLWEAIAGQRMHGNASPYEISRRLVHGELPNIRDVVRDVPVPLEHILERALALKPEDRYPDANPFRQDLVAFLETFRRVSVRQVGDYVAELFASERRRLAEVIRRGMQFETEPDQTPWHLRTAKIPNIGAGFTPSTPTPRSTPPGTQSTVPPVNLSDAPRPAQHKKWLPALFVLAMLGVAVGLAFSFRSSKEREPGSTAVASPPPAPEPQMVENPAAHVTPVEPPPSEGVPSELEMKKPPSLAARGTTAKASRADSTSGPVRRDTKPVTKPPDPYVEFPTVKRRKAGAPPLDTSNPWSAE
jgi:serine/threonine protein kinase